MTTNRPIITNMGNPLWGAAPPAAWAMASGINEFMVLSHALRRIGASRSGAAAYFGRKKNLCHRDLRGFGGFPHIPANHLVQRSGFDAGPQVPHELQVVMQVVRGVQAAAEDFTAPVEVPQIGARVVAAGVTGAGRIERPGIRLVRGVADV